MKWHIDYYQKENGEIPVLEFLISLPPKLRAKNQSTIDLLEACGTNLQAPYVAPVKGDKYKGLLGASRQAGLGYHARLLLYLQRQSVYPAARFSEKDDEDAVK